ncbi:MAG: SDR family oxidoreductase [Rhodospirillales bacterium]|nr:SDR family oxidoreductase [Rhodospirillales bacterium]
MAKKKSTKPPGRVKGKTALVTGAGSGLGRASAIHLAREGANIIASDIDLAAADETAALINEDHDRAAIGVQHDVTLEEDWRAVLFQAKFNFGGLNILLNNAGISIGGDIESTSFFDWKKLQEIDVDSIFWGCKLALPYMVDSGGGSIINISSTVGIYGNPLTLAYGTAKAAVRHMTKSVALHCAKEGYNIRCNSVHPTFIKTPLLKRFADAVGDEDKAYETLASVVPMKKILETDDVTFGIIYLASDESCMMTGAELVIDGGLTAGYMPPV